MSRSQAQAMTMSVKDLPQEKYDELEKYINELDQKKGALIHVLHKAQEIFTFFTYGSPIICCS